MAAAWNFARTCIIQQIMILKKIAPRVEIPIKIAYISKYDMQWVRSTQQSQKQRNSTICWVLSGVLPEGVFQWSWCGIL